MSNLKQGRTGAEVKKLQTALNARGYSLAIDGEFGPATLAAVKDYQARKGLAVDGIVGPKTWGALDLDYIAFGQQVEKCLGEIAALPSVKKLWEMM